MREVKNGTNIHIDSDTAKILKGIKQTMGFSASQVITMFVKRYGDLLVQDLQKFFRNEV